MSDSVPDTFFAVDERDGSEWFRPLDPCRGPWDPDACHAGPPTGLIVRAGERAVPGQQLVRVAVDLIRPIPFSGFTIETTVVRSGRTVSTTEMRLVDGEGQAVVSARGMHLAPGDPYSFPTPPVDTPRLADAEPGPFPFERALHDLPAFMSGVEIRYPPDETREPGPTTAWMRALPLLPDEHPSGFQRIAPLADCGNALSRNTEPDEVGFVNTDLVVHLHRAPIGEWFGMSAVSRWEPNGIGISDGLLFDDHGPVGRAVQSLVLRPTP